MSKQTAPIEEFKPSEPVDFEQVMDTRVSLEEPAHNIVANPPPKPPKDPDPVEVVENEGEADIKKFSPIPPDEEHRVTPDRKAEKKAENSKIREELKKVAEERAAYEAQVKEYEAKVKEYEDRVTKVSNDFEAKNKEIEELRRQMAVGDPEQHPQMREIEQPWINKRNDVMAEVELTGADPKQFNSWTFGAVQHLAKAGEPGTDGYREAVAAIRQDFLRKFPESGDYLMSSMNLVREGVNTLKKRQAFAVELQNNYPTIQFKESMKHYEAALSQYEQDERRVFNPEEDIKMNDPLNQTCILRAMIDGSEEVRKAAEACKAVVKYTMLPPKPVDPASLEGQDDAAKVSILQNHNSKYVGAFTKLRSRAAEYLLAYQVLPALWKELEALRAKVKEREPRPNLNGNHIERQAVVQAVDTDEVKGFQPVENPELAAIKAGRR